MIRINRFTRKSLLPFFTAFVFLLTGCENFLKSEDVKQDIVNTIEYNNAPSYVINVETIDQDKCGKVKTPATGEITKKVSDVFPVRFEPADGYKFIRWEAVVRGMSTGEKASDYIEFENSESLETKVTFKKASAQVIVIRPVCPPRLTYSLYQSGGEVYPRDSSIEFVFNETLAACSFTTSAEDYITVQNLPEGTTSSTYFKAPQINGKKLVFQTDTTNGYIPMTNNGQKGVTVKIPKESIWYINEQYSEPVKVYLDTDIKETYVINSETSAKTSVKFVLLQEDELPLGTLKIDGEENDNKAHLYSVGQTFSLRYKVPDGYSFKQWLFKNSQGNIIDSSDLNFSFSEEDNSSNLILLSISVNNYVAEPLTITPDIYENLAVTKFNLDDEEKVYERDSDIVITFNKPINPECKDNIIVKIPGLARDKSVSDYFEAAELNQNVLTMKAKRADVSNLIPLSSDGTNTITVSIPLGVYYDGVSAEGNQVNIGLDSPKTFSYKINSKTTKRTKIKFQLDSNNPYGTLKTGGITRDSQVIEYNMGEKIDLTYTLSKEESESYVFTNWKITHAYTDSEGQEQAVDVSPSSTESLKFSFVSGLVSNTNDLMVYGASIGIEDSIDGTVTIMPVVTRILSANVSLNGENGKFSPAKDTYNYKFGKTYHIEFESDKDYAFIRWQLVNAATGTEIPKNEEDGSYPYITSSDWNNEKMDVSLIAVPAIEDDIRLELRPLVAERPQTISESPLRNSAGVLRDTTIQVMFDFDMDESSIYYTPKELNDIHNTHFSYMPELLYKDFDDLLKEESPLDFDCVVYYTASDGTKKYFGYQKNGERYLKNISIVNSRNDANMNARFKAPIFENPRTLSIQAYRDNPLAPGTNVMVTLDKNFFYSLDDKEISMGQAKKWVYLVNGDIDEIKPSIIKNIVVNDSLGAEVKPSNTEPEAGSLDVSNLQFFVNGKFNLSFKVSDNTAPDSTFNIICTKILDSSYNSVDKTSVTKNIPYTTCYGQNAVFGAETGNEVTPEVCTLKDLSDGLYSMYFEFADGSGNKIKYPSDSKLYYFCLDHTAPDMDAPTVTSPDNSTTELKLTWDYSTVKDYKEAYFEYWPYDGSEADAETTPVISKGTNTTTITGLNLTTRYNIQANYIDQAGNKKTVTTDAYTCPAAPKSVSVSTAYGTSTTITATKPDSGNFSSFRIQYRISGEEEWTSAGTVSAGSNGTASKTISNLENGYIYEFEVSSYDSISGKDSKPYKSGTAYPTYTTTPRAPAQITTEFNNFTNQGIVTVTKPVSGNYTGYIVYCSTTSTFDTNTTVSQTISNNNGSTQSVTFTSLVPGTQYYVKARAYYGTTGNYAEIIRSSPTFTKTAPVTNLKLDSTTNTSLKLSWTKPSGGVSSYRITYKREGDTNWSNLTCSDPAATSYTISSLSGGEKYWVGVVACCYNDSETVQNSSLWQINPNPPTNINAETLSKTSFRLTWDAPVGNYDGYRLYYAKSEYDLTANASLYKHDVTKGTSSYDAKDLTSEGFYYIKLESYIGTGSLRTYTDVTYCSLKLDAVKNLTVSATATNKIKLTWTNPATTSYDGVKIYRGTSTTPIATPSKGTTTFEDTNLSTNTSYTYKVLTYKTENNEYFETYQTKTCSTLSSAVSSLTTSSNAAGEVTLSWSNPSSSYYENVAIYRGGTSSSYLIAKPNKGTTSYTDTSLKGGTSYTYYVVTQNKDSVDNNYSNYKSQYTMPSSVTSLSWNYSNQTSVTLTWTKPSGTYTGYRIYYQLNSASAWTQFKPSGYTDGNIPKSAADPNSGSSYYSVTGLTAGKTYNFKVETYYSNVTNAASYTWPTCTAYTKSNAVTNVAVSSRSNDSITYTWTNPTGSYDWVRLYYRTKSDSSYSYKSMTKGATSYTLTGLTAGTGYDVYFVSYYYSSSYLVSGSSTGNSSSYPIKTSTVPYSPTSLSVSISGSGTKLSWSAPSSGSVTGYKIFYQKYSNGSWQSSSNLTTTSTSYTFGNTALDGSTRYCFWVQSYSIYNDTQYSSSTSTVYIYTPPSSVTNVSLYQDDLRGNVVISWKNPISTLTGVNVYIDDSYKATQNTCNPSSYSYQALTLPSFYRGKSYTIKLKPYNSLNGTSAYAPESTFEITSDMTNSYKIMVNGTRIANSNFENVITTSTTISKNSSYTGGAFTSSRTVTLTKYSMGKYEVTQDLFYAVMGYTPSVKTLGNSKPVSNVSWYEAIAFCNKLSAIQGLDLCYTISGISYDDWKNKSMTTNSSYSSTYYIIIPTSDSTIWNGATFNLSNNGYHLPTEAQWEFAARGGNTSVADWSYKYAGSSTLTNYAWYSSNSNGTYHDVGNKTGNRLYLYDMTGNVWEWLTDWNNNVPDGTFTDPFCQRYQPSNNSNAMKYNDSGGVLKKGGSWDTSDTSKLQNDYNSTKDYPKNTDSYTGFRLCRNVNY